MTIQGWQENAHSLILEQDKKILEEKIPLEAKLCLSHIYPERVSLNANIQKLKDFSLLQA